MSCISFLSHCGLDLVSTIIVSVAYLLYYLRWESQIKYMDAFWMVICVLGIYDLDL